ncbi:MAG: isoprenylcysteine carboxylmethyltransferase family protein [Gammaproteobacteria bacterium]|nr:MAG: isoprenylcysteine carboxylmethyltransferase family protein [Gammaproteobacteria bacterium]
MTAEDKRGPGLKFPPALLALAAIGCAWLADQVRPLPIAASDGLRLAGITIIALAVLLALIALVQFIRASTHVEPWRPTTKVIRTGVFRFSRNPIYLSFCIATVGIGLLLNSWWVVASVTVIKPLLEHFVISREEAYLEKKYGEHYLEYKRQVRRWL